MNQIKKMKVFNKVIQTQIESNKDLPTEVNPEILKQFEIYQTLVNQKNNPISNQYSKKNKGKKTNNLIGVKNITINNNNINDNNCNNDNNILINNYIIETKEENEDKYKKTNKNYGLDDNYLNDYQNKRKAKLALLKLMFDFSGGKFCKEINDYFDKNKSKNNSRDLKVSNYQGEKSYKNFIRQKCIDSFDSVKDNKTSEIYSEGLSKASDIEFMKKRNKQNLNNLNFLNKNKKSKNKYKDLYLILDINLNSNLQKIEEERNQYINKKKYTEDLNENELINFFSKCEIDRQNVNYFISFKKNKKIKMEGLKKDNVNFNNNFDVRSFNKFNREGSILRSKTLKKMNLKQIPTSKYHKDKFNESE
jgi:hypothetical protein